MLGNLSYIGQTGMGARTQGLIQDFKAKDCTIQSQMEMDLSEAECDLIIYKITS